MAEDPHQSDIVVMSLLVEVGNALQLCPGFTYGVLLLKEASLQHWILQWFQHGRMWM